MFNSKIPSEIYKIYQPLNSEVFQLHIHWNFYRELYCQSQETIDLLDKSAISFFLHLHNILLEYLILSIARLSDPKQQGKFDNLTLDQLIESIDANKYSSLKAHLAAFLSSESQKFEPIRKLRNNLVAHNDLKERANNFPFRLPPVMHSEPFEDSLQIIRTSLNFIESFFDGGGISYKESYSSGNADDLLACLSDAQEYRKHFTAEFMRKSERLSEWALIMQINTEELIERITERAKIKGISVQDMLQELCL